MNAAADLYILDEGFERLVASCCIHKVAQVMNFLSVWEGSLGMRLDVAYTFDAVAVPPLVSLTFPMPVCSRDLEDECFHDERNDHL